MQTRRVYVLTARRNASKQLKPASKDDQGMRGSDVDGSIIGTAQSMEDIADEFEGLLNVPVVNETGRDGKYNYFAVTKGASRESAARDLAHQLGLELTQAERQIEMLVVRNVQ